MAMRLSRLATIVVICALTDCVQVVGQSCRDVASSMTAPVPDPLNDTWIHIYWQTLAVTQTIASEALMSRRDGTDFSVQVGTDTDSIWTSLRQDTTRLRYLAEALAGIMAAQNLKIGDASAVVAASLYEHWELPPGPALSVLGDPLQGTRSRLLALRAARRSVGTSTVERAILSALCSLASNAAAIESLRKRRDGDPLSRSLQADDFAFYMEIQATLARHGNPSTMVQRVESLLPQGNPVRETLITFLRQLR